LFLADFNTDGWPDLAIANDTLGPTFLFFNKHGRTFRIFSFVSSSVSVWPQAGAL